MKSTLKNKYYEIDKAIEIVMVIITIIKTFISLILVCDYTKNNTTSLKYIKQKKMETVILC